MTMDAIAIYALVCVFLWGAVWGSFLNVVIWRLPRGMNLARPASHCPSCGNPIAWHDNVPIFGWLRLRGRCRNCRTPISARYPGVELLCAVLSTALFWHAASDGRFDVEPFQVVLVPWLFHFFFALILVAIAFIDLDLTIIPHELTFPGMAWGLLGALLLPKTGVWVGYFPSVDIVDAAIGMVAGAGFLWLVFRGYLLATGRYGIGGGDLTMLGLIGANLGWQSLLFVILAASLQGVLAAGVAVVIERRRAARGQGAALLIRGAHRAEFWESDPMDPQQTDAEKPVDEAPEDESALRLALPFGPFLALAALQYFFLGRWFHEAFLSGALLG